MYKTKLQELCQRRSWSLPEYQTTREGPNHNPRFSSTVTVNDTPFRSSSPTRNAKLAQNNAAMLAFHHFSEPNPIPNPIPNPVPVPVPVPDPVPSIPNLSSFPQPSLCAHSTSSSPGSPCPSPDVDKILPTNTVLPPTGEATCQTPQISSPVTTDKDITKAQDQKNVLHLYKNQLQSYAQKRNLNLPVYSSEWEGPPHSLRFKCKVTIDGQSYESPKFYSTLKDAEHAAAEVALMSLAPSGVQEDNTGLYKNLLQELVQKEGFHLPIYSTTKSGEAHMPVFMSQVEVDGEHFTGQEAKSKKQAEMSAAKVAYTALKERKEQVVDPVFATYHLQSRLRNRTHSLNHMGTASDDVPHIPCKKLKVSSSSPSTRPSLVEETSDVNPQCSRKVTDDLQFLFENDMVEVEEMMKKYSDELSGTLGYMEQRLELLLDAVMSKCRSMTLVEKQRLQKLIQKLPAGNLDRVVEIICRNRPVEEQNCDKIFVDLEKEDNSTLWRLYYYVEAVEKAKSLSCIEEA